MNQGGNLRLVQFILFGVLLNVPPIFSQTSYHKNLFDGESLEGWYDPGTGEWSVVDGAIYGRNPTKNWNHLITKDSTYGNFEATLKWKNITGNTGLYFRVHDGGTFGISGLQIELGSNRDGSVMWVTESKFAFEEGSLSHEANKGIVKEGEWNTLEVLATDSGYTTKINGEIVIDNPQVEEMIRPRGALALQLHAGANNEVYFKDIEIWVPHKIPGCTDSNYLEFDSTANFSRPEDCKNMPVPSNRSKVNFEYFHVSQNGLEFPNGNGLHPKLYNSKGQPIPLRQLGENQYGFPSEMKAGLYFLSTSAKRMSFVYF